jgi:hypothetical protein
VKKFLISSIILGCMLILAGMNLVPYETPKQAPAMVFSCPEYTGAVLAHVLNMLQTGSSQDNNQGIGIRASLSSPSFNFLMKRMMPTWGRVNLLKRTVCLNFFFPALALVMFFIFYQASRTASENDPH